MEGQLPTESMPFIWGDFNARGWAGGGDDSIYALDRDAIASLKPQTGTLAFVYDDDDPGQIFGYVATLEFITLGAFTGWRAKPVPGSFYRGPKPAHQLCEPGA